MAGRSTVLRMKARYFLVIALLTFVAGRYLHQQLKSLRLRKGSEECNKLGTSFKPNGTLVDISGKDSQSEQQIPRVALCLFGEARRFELSGPTIKSRLLDVLPHADVFINSPLDRNSYKLAAILTAATSRFAKARIFTPTKLPEEKLLKDVIATEGSSHGLQGLLQYFSLIEGCGDLIWEYEQLHGFQYDWIIKTRLDTYWTDSVPTVYERGVYTVPFGSYCGGLNDRFGVADRGTAMAAGLRLSMLSALHAQGIRNLWSEPLFESQLKLQRIAPVAGNFSFCLLDHRRWRWPPTGFRLPVVSLSSKGPVNGAYCRPCRPVVSEFGRASEMVENLCKRSGWFPTQGMQKLELCDASKLAWEDDWESVFDRVAGSEAAATRVRAGKRNFGECVVQARKFQAKWDVWNGPSPEVMCKIESENPWPKFSATSS